MAFAQAHGSLCSRSVVLLLAALACVVAGCTAAVSRTVQPPSPMSEVASMIVEEKVLEEKSLGLAVANLTPEMRRRFQLDPALQGVVVTAVEPDGPAADSWGHRGFHPGDVIGSVSVSASEALHSNNPISSVDDFANAMKAAAGQQTVWVYVADKRRVRYINKRPVSQADGKTAAIIVTSGPLSQSYEALGSVHADTMGGVNFGAALNDAFFRSPLAASIQASPKASTEEMNRMLREKAREQYGGRVDAVINVTYRTEPRGNVFADGLAVHFTPQPPPPASAPPVRSTEERLKEIRGLLDQGLITQGEYERKRWEILKEL